MPPTVSVVIPCFNHGRFLRDTVASVLAQGQSNVEVVVIDDGSTDETADVSAEFGDSIVYVYQSNRGLSDARNTGILRARGEYVQLLDADDLLRPNALAAFAAAAASNPAGDVFRGAWEEIDADGLTTATVTSRSLGGDAFHALFDPLAVGPPCRHMVRRSAVLDAGLFDPTLTSCEDWDLWLRLALRGHEFVEIPEVVCSYRNYRGSMSKNHARMWDAGRRVLARACAAHGCPRCEEAYKQGIAEWRRYCYLSILREDIRRLVLERRFRESADVAGHALRHDPKLLPLIGRSVLNNVRPRS